jgi:RNHCP domain
VDIDPGDRASTCGGMMRPERVERRSGKGLVLVHRCIVCGFIRPNRIADDVVQGDDIDAIATLMAKAR